MDDLRVPLFLEAPICISFHRNPPETLWPSDLDLFSIPPTTSAMGHGREAQLQAGHPDAALEEAEEQLKSLSSAKGIYPFSHSH